MSTITKVLSFALIGTGLVAAAVVVHGRRPRREPAPLTAEAAPVPVQESAPPPAAAPPPTIAAPAACGDGYVPKAQGHCRPVNAKSGRPYSDAELAHFDQMRATPYVSPANFFVPRVMTSAEAEQQRALFAHMNELARMIEHNGASPQQIDEYFRFRTRQTSYRMQMLAYLHASAGGRISKHDPNLDPDLITDPDLKARYLALRAEEDADYEREGRARVARGLPAHEPPAPWPGLEGSVP